MIENMSAVKLLNELAEGYYPYKKNYQPGEYFNKLSEADKEILRGLKSSDTQKIRFERWML